MKKYLISYSKILLEVLISTLILSLFLYLDFYSNNIYNYLELITLFLIFYFNGKKLGNLVNKNYYLEGIKLGLTFTLLFTIFNIIFVKDISVKLFIYYLIIILISILGSIRKKSAVKKH